MWGHRSKAKTWPTLDHAAGQSSHAQQKIHNKMTENEKNQGVAKARSKSRAQPDWNAAAEALSFDYTVHIREPARVHSGQSDGNSIIR